MPTPASPEMPDSETPGSEMPGSETPGSEMPDTSGGLFDPSCELCEAARFTHWYYEDDICWVADCEACETPMVVWRQHGTDPPTAELEHMLRHLQDAAEVRFGKDAAKIDRVMRQVPDHFHAHARDSAWMSRRWSDPPSRYTGVGTERTTAMSTATERTTAMSTATEHSTPPRQHSTPPRQRLAALRSRLARPLSQVKRLFATSAAASAVRLGVVAVLIAGAATLSACSGASNSATSNGASSDGASSDGASQPTTTSPPTDLSLPSQISEGLLAEGESVYLSTCAICHGREGEGDIGPPLLEVATRLSEIEHLVVVELGRGEMQPFRSLLDPDEIVAVVAYQREQFG